MNLLDAKAVHLVGIKGVAMTALALSLSDLGVTVTGSDLPEEFVTEAVLRQRNFKIFDSFDSSHITQNIELVVFTGAHEGQNNPEVVEAQNQGIQVMSHARALGDLIYGKKLISVCGTGGKSTTSAMLAWILASARLNPSFAIGVGNIPNFGVPGRFVPDSDWFVAEADEYAVDPTSDLRPRFVFQHPEVIICTNLKYDHPDIYLSFDKTKEVFLEFFNSLPDSGTLIVNGDDVDLTSLLSRLKTKAKVIKVGTGPENDYRLSDIENRGHETIGKLTRDQDSLTVTLAVPGAFNLMNALMAWAAAQVAGADDATAQASLRTFKGTMRRFEWKGQARGADWYDDYAHTPPEIEATLAALKLWYPTQHKIAVFQPHTYSRTKALFSGFSRSFTDADEVILLDIFASARETEDRSISSDLLEEGIQKTDRSKTVKNMKTIEKASKYLTSKLTKDVVVITLGAGDVYKLFAAVEAV